TLSLPAVFSTNILSGVRFFGLDILDFEDRIVSALLLPIGALIYTLFCTSRSGWGWDNFIAELNSGIGIKAPARTRLYMKLILPAMIALLLVFSFI
ncbi:MAG: sodium-dependent transporter, partial [Clostridia bacterium]|nr:sodium-dependent transporter [Clostridia bacterium]